MSDDYLVLNTKLEKLKVNVAIIGNGPAGTTVALMLAKSGISVCLIGLPSHNKILFGETLPPKIKFLLIHLGVWKEFLEDGHMPSTGNISAWGDKQLREDHFIFHPNTYGWHLDRLKFNLMLIDAVKKNGIYYFDSKIVSIHEPFRNIFSIRLKKQNKSLLDFIITADFIVDATGRSSWFSYRKGVRKSISDSLCGYVCFHSSRIEGDVDSMTLIESVPEGWWYSALLPRNNRVVAFFTDSNLPIAEYAKTTAGWNRMMQNTNYIKLSLEKYDYHNISGPHIMMSNSSKLEKVIGENWLAIGDAAATYDPLSSMGIVNAINDGINASDIIVNYLNGNTRYLDEYNRNMTTNFKIYLQKRAFYYEQEKRWTDFSFWKQNQNYCY